MALNSLAARPEEFGAEKIDAIWNELWKSDKPRIAIPRIEELSEKEVVKQLAGKWTVLFGVTPDTLTITVGTNFTANISGQKEGKPWKKTGQWRVISEKLVLFLEEENVPSFIFRMAGRNYIFDPWAETMMSELRQEATPENAGLDFLRKIPEFRDLSLQITHAQLRSHIEKHGLFSRQEFQNGRVTYWLLTTEGENVFVGFEAGKCTGIQRMQPIPKSQIPEELGAGVFAAWMAERSTAKIQWSEPVKGLRARLIVLRPEKSGSPFCRVFIELENVEEVLGQKRIRFDPARLTLRVTDQNGKELPPANGPYDGISPRWEPIALPHAATIKFQINSQGLGYQPDKDKMIIDLGARNSWVIPQGSSTYFLSGTLTIEKKEGDHPYMDWSGTLELPKVEIPKAP